MGGIDEGVLDATRQTGSGRGAHSWPKNGVHFL